jgi:hypothetical protein
MSDAPRKTSMNMKMMITLVRKVQEEIVRLNELGMELFQLGKLKSAAFHFNHALQRVNEISVAKNSLSQNEVASLPPPSSVFPAGTMVKRACQPLPLDSMSSAMCVNWEAVASMALIHNSALVHMQVLSFRSAKHLLELSISMMKRQIRDSELNTLLSRSKYSASVVVSVYITLGKTLSRMMMFQPHAAAAAAGNDAEKNVLPAQTKKAFQIATGLMTRYLAKKKQNKPSVPQTQIVSASAMTDANIVSSGLHSHGCNKSILKKADLCFANDNRHDKAMSKMVKTSSSIAVAQKSVSSIHVSKHITVSKAG